MARYVVTGNLSFFASVRRAPRRRLTLFILDMSCNEHVVWTTLVIDMVIVMKTMKKWNNAAMQYTIRVECTTMHYSSSAKFVVGLRCRFVKIACAK